MSFYVYMLKSLGKRPVTYVGYTSNLNERITLHNNAKGAKFTRGRKWIIAYSKVYDTKSKAMREEYKLKKNYILRKKIKSHFNK